MMVGGVLSKKSVINYGGEEHIKRNRNGSGGSNFCIRKCIKIMIKTLKGAFDLIKLLVIGSVNVQNLVTMPFNNLIWSKSK